MQWEEYYEKINDWAVSTAVSKISALENMGTSSEVTEAINIIGFEDEKGATRLLNAAVKYGIKFSGEDLAELEGVCTDNSLMEALQHSADQFTSKDLDELYGCFEDELLIEIALKYNITVPAELAEENEELLFPDTNTPIDWERFYNNYDNWSEGYAKARFDALTSYGNEDELIEVLGCLFSEDKAGANKYVRKMLDQGITFAGDNLIEVTFICDDSTIRKAVLAAQHRLDDEILEELYGVVDDSLIKQVAKKNGLRLPECMREDEEWETDTGVSEADDNLTKEDLAGAYDYILECLFQAHERLITALKLSIADVGGNKRAVSIAKHAALLEAIPYIDEARCMLEDIESQVQDKLSVHDTRLNLGKHIIFHDVVGDGFITDWMVQRRIQKMVRVVEDAHKEVLKLKSKL